MFKIHSHSGIWKGTTFIVQQESNSKENYREDSVSYHKAIDAVEVTQVEIICSISCLYQQESLKAKNMGYCNEGDWAITITDKKMN